MPLIKGGQFRGATFSDALFGGATFQVGFGGAIGGATFSRSAR